MNEGDVNRTMLRRSCSVLTQSPASVVRWRARLLHAHERAFDFFVSCGGVPSAAGRGPAWRLAKAQRDVRQCSQGRDEGIGPIVERIPRAFYSFDARRQILHDRLNLRSRRLLTKRALNVGLAPLRAEHRDARRGKTLAENEPG